MLVNVRLFNKRASVVVWCVGATPGVHGLWAGLTKSSGASANSDRGNLTPGLRHQLLSPGSSKCPRCESYDFWSHDLMRKSDSCWGSDPIYRSSDSRNQRSNPTLASLMKNRYRSSKKWSGGTKLASEKGKELKEWKDEWMGWLLGFIGVQSYVDKHSHYFSLCWISVTALVIRILRLFQQRSFLQYTHAWLRFLVSVFQKVVQFGHFCLY